jgi:hypothetical protein
MCASTAEASGVVENMPEDLPSYSRICVEIAISMIQARSGDFGVVYGVFCSRSCRTLFKNRAEERGKVAMSELAKSETISRRKVLSLLGLGGALTCVAASALTASEADAQTAGMVRRQERRAERHERREKRRAGRHERREKRRTGQPAPPAAPAAATPAH